MSHFAAAEANRDLYLISVFQKLQRVTYFCFEVMRVNIKRHADFFHFYDLLVFSRFFFLLSQFEPIFAVVHNAADRRRCLRRDLDKIKILSPRQF